MTGRLANRWQRFIPDTRSTAVRVVVLVLAIDVFFIGLDLVAGGAAGFPERLHVGRERGVPEAFQYLKWLAAALLMWTLGGQAVVYRVWAAIFAYLLVDDVFSLHENVGLAIARVVPIERPFGLDLETWVFPEIAYQLVVAVVVLAALAAALRGTDSVAARRFTIVGIGLLILFAGFSVGGDFVLHLVAPFAHKADVLEDGGELVVGTLLFGHVLLHVVEQRGRDAARADAAGEEG